jgi:ketosteroid isomerase-like protein
MKPPVAAVLVAMLMCSDVIAHDSKPGAAASAPQSAPEAKPVVAIVEKFSDALQAADFERVSALLADDVLILESGGAERSKKEYLGHHALADAMFLKTAHVEVTRRTANVAGAMAWVGTESEVLAQEDGKPLTLSSTETMVLRRSSTGWRIVHIHWSSRPKKEHVSSAPAP